MAPGGYEDHHGDLHGGCGPGGRFAAARLAGDVHRDSARHDSAGGETSAGSSRGSSAADVDEGRLNGTKPEWERHDEARGGDTREPGGGGKPPRPSGTTSRSTASRRESRAQDRRVK